MRRSDREFGEIGSILQKCTVLRLGLCDGDRPYVVPMNFGYDLDGASLTLYLHCAREGKKLDLIAQNPNACFEMDCAHELVRGKAACSSTFYYESLIGSGQIETLEAFEEKVYALQRLMERQCGKDEGAYEFDGRSVNAVTVLKLKCAEISAKVNRRKE